ncbi:uncharacterized protein LOC113589653 isoform X2 [Electrophorus electricus]|uniref:uncharacterized protein LOC113589653 isoform X2 n=1 Tax=Electrophorus electricus TaxID=8005 RepID=UPI0015D0B3A1|nr:uncharacterized protein LOC113589653 isoform X2 [Electrophorus electricus]
MSNGMKLESASPAPTCMSVKSELSMDRPINFNNGMKLESASPAPTCMSVKSELSMDRPINFHNGELSASLLKEDHFRCSLCTDVLKEPVYIPCGHCYCKICIQTYWTKPSYGRRYSCPQCRKRFNTCPVLKPNSALAKVVEKLQQAGLSPAHCYAGPGDVECDFCTGRKLRALKSCLTCTASYCETHVRQHYTVAALQRHTMVDATEDLEQRLCQLHHKALEVFCKTDQTFICLICMMEEHKEHDTVVAKSEAPTDEANTSVKKHQKIRKFDSLEENKMEKEIKHLLKENKELTTKVENLQRADTELTYLAKLLCRGLEEDFVEMAALGRRLDLGMLYDCRCDSVCSDVFLWDESTLSSMKLSLSRPHTDVRILEGESLQERLQALDLNPFLRASVVSGLVEVAGAAAFLNHSTQSWLQDRVTLDYRNSTRLDMLNHTLLHSGAPLSLTNQNTATHVVMAVLYGVQAFFVFDNKTESSEGNTVLRTTFKKMIASSCETELISCLTESEHACCSLYDTAHYIDGNDVTSPMNFDTPLKLYSLLQKLKDRTAVPLKVWLYPLKKLDPTLPHVVGDISGNILSKTENVLECSERSLRVCQKLIYSNISLSTWAPALKDAFCQFSACLQQYRSEFQRALAFCIKAIREIGEGEESLRDLLQRHEQSCFSPENIRQWLQNREAEVRALNELRDNDVTIVKSQKELKEVTQDSQTDSVLCLILTSVGGKDPFLSALKQHIDSVNAVNTQETQPSFRLSDTSHKVLSDLHLFLAYKETDKTAEKIKFIAAPLAKSHSPASSIYLYQSGHLVSCNVKLDVKPEILPKIIAVKERSVKLKLQSSKTRRSRYRVEYRAVSCRVRDPVEMKWRVSDTYLGENWEILGLTPETLYQLRYAVMNSNSLSDYSRITEFQTRPRARPGRPEIVRQFDNSLTVAWRKVKGDSPVLHYMVEYMKVGLEGWQSILTEGPKCECTITFSSHTCYRVRVSAVYGEGITSRPSEEAEVPVDEWSINLSEKKASLFLEALKLQTGKKPVELRGWPDEESEVRSFVQCLPYISRLRIHYNKAQEKMSVMEFMLKLMVATAESHAVTIESFNKLLTPECQYSFFSLTKHYLFDTFEQCNLLLDVYSCVKDSETQTGRSVLPALQRLYRSAPEVWYIDLSERKASLFLEVLKLQTVKKQVQLRGWPDEKSEVRSFLQCLPYISQLSFLSELFWELLSKTQKMNRKREVMKVLLKLMVAAAACDAATGESFTKLLTSVCSYTAFPFEGDYYNYYPMMQCDFLLEMYLFAKNYEIQTGRRVLPALQRLYQSVPAAWTIDLSERKASFFLEVLKLQTVKKPVKLIGWSDEENEVSSFLQCLPYISRLRCSKAMLLHFLDFVHVGTELECMRHAVALSRALGEMVDLSQKRLNQQACRSLALFLEHSEGLSELDLSHCQLTDHCLQLLFPHLHKAHILE